MKTFLGFIVVCLCVSTACGFMVSYPLTNPRNEGRYIRFRVGEIFQVGRDRQNFVCMKDTFFYLYPRESRVVRIEASCTIPIKQAPERGTPVEPASVRVAFQPVAGETPRGALGRTIDEVKRKAQAAATTRSQMY